MTMYYEKPLFQIVGGNAACRAYYNVIIKIEEKKNRQTLVASFTFGIFRRQVHL